MVLEGSDQSKSLAEYKINHHSNTFLSNPKHQYIKSRVSHGGYQEDLALAIDPNVRVPKEPHRAKCQDSRGAPQNQESRLLRSPTEPSVRTPKEPHSVQNLINKKCKLVAEPFFPLDGHTASLSATF